MSENVAKLRGRLPPATAGESHFAVLVEQGGAATDDIDDDRDEESECTRSDGDRLLGATSAASLMQRVLPADEHLLASLITRTSRMFLVGPTGAGKSMLALALAGGMASGCGFLSWRSCRPSRVLYIDGEMSLRTLQTRVSDLARRMGGQDALAGLHLISWQNAAALGVGDLTPLNTEAGQHFVRRICNLIRPDVIVLDNVQALIGGDMKDEVPWNETWPLVAWLTAQQIGQVWIDHTGHNTSRQYGSSTKAWKFDTVGLIAPLPRDECAAAETAFTLSFEAPGKARNRGPDTWADYETCTIRLHEDRWTSDDAATGPAGAKRLTADQQNWLRDLTDMFAEPGAAIPRVPLEGMKMVPTLTREQVRSGFRRRGRFADPDATLTSADRERMRFFLNKLRDNKKIGMTDQLVWLLSSASGPSGSHQGRTP